MDQVWDYALDLKNFHETSHDRYIAPILIATKVKNISPVIALNSKERSQKSFYFVTGVQGAGKTLVGLNIATTHIGVNHG
jgi:hypothetical protein